MDIQDYAQGKSLEELLELHQSGEDVGLDRIEGGKLLRIVRRKLIDGEVFSEDEQLLATMLLSSEDHHLNSIVLMIPKLHRRTLALLDNDRHENIRQQARYHPSQPLDLLLERGAEDKYPRTFYYSLSSQTLDREIEIHLLKLTRRNELSLLIKHLTIRHEDEEFQRLLMDTFARMSNAARIKVSRLDIWSPESLDELQRTYADDVKLIGHLCSQSLLTEETSLRILGADKVHHSIRSVIVCYTRHYSIWQELSKRSEYLTRISVRNPYFGDNPRAEAYRESLKGQNNGS